jgi:hypothetical protein
MAKAKSKTKKLSRRELVTLLGSGMVFMGTAGGGTAEAQAKAKGRGKANANNPPPPPPPSVCQNVIPFEGRAGTGNNAHTILMANPCCKEGVNVFFTGFDKVGNPTKGHLKDFADLLTGSKNALEEYCVMVWGLKGQEQVDLVKSMTEKFQMTAYKAKK